MLNSTVKPLNYRKKYQAITSLGYDFALLGLGVSESRVDVIRDAASHTAARIQRAAWEDAEETDRLLSDVVSSTYRLLDPRKRSKPRERIQLSIVSDLDFDIQKGSRRPLVDFPADVVEPAKPLVAAEVVATHEMTLRGKRPRLRLGRICLSVVLVILTLATTAAVLSLGG